MRLALFLFIITSTSACNDYSRASYVMTRDKDLEPCHSVNQNSKENNYHCECIKGFSIAGYTGMHAYQVICVQD